MIRPPTSCAAAPGHDAGWRWWFGPVGFAAALTVTVVVISLLAGVVRVAGGDGHRSEHAVARVGILIQDAVFILVAIVFARGVGVARAASFGLRPTRLAPAAGLVALSLIVFYATSATWSSLVSSAGKQDTLATLGTQETPLLLIVSAVTAALSATLFMAALGGHGQLSPGRDRKPG